MEEKLIFSKIENSTIFVDDYKSFSNNNTISFSKEGIAVLYGPNGTGKTSLVKTIDGEKGSKINYKYAGNDYTDGSLFYVINDQNNRNIIGGSAKDFLLGDNIKKEFELQDYIKGEYEKLCLESISALKSNNISSGSSKGIDCCEKDTDMVEIIKDLSNNKSKGSKISIDKYISKMEQLADISTKIYEEEKMLYLINELATKGSLLEDIEALEIKKITCNSNIKEVEENTEAIKILKHFDYKKQCVVCDTNNINVIDLLAKKTDNREKIIKELDPKTKKIIEKMIGQIDALDPFEIKKTLLNSIETGVLTGVEELKNSIDFYKERYFEKVCVEMVNLYRNSDIKEKYEEYQQMISTKPEITEEDFLYIEEIINNSMSKNLQIVRDERKNIKIVLENQEFLGMDRGKLPLSTGEQNFLSLTFEFLKAKNSDRPIVILDDPISSFDSIYKNKIAYAIVKILQNKKRIILTHNVDLLRLLDGQFKKCFKLFLFNNVDNEENGFIALNFKEQDMLINLEKLLHTFRNDIYPHIKSRELFLISMIPFMRGYAALNNAQKSKEDLTQLMHGYKTKKINIAGVYHNIFGDANGKLEADKNNVIQDIYEISVNDILSMTVDGKDILDKNKYPLLNRTLIHSFSYLFLRLLIEKKLVEKFSIDTSQYDQLGQIIAQAFPNDNDSQDIKKRVMLTSKKTLLNEFNHFEGNMSIFQPAIDITDYMLNKEKTDILSFVTTL